ncbi:MAG: hypothetical protein K5634_03910 [Sphaerochaetaceae bacterium]|nr:hypothetical protein [Sphaerochaetaceae bacterium]
MTGQLEKLTWFPFSDEPVISPLRFVPQFCDPQVIMPSQAVDGRWHMFFHSWIGVHHFVSDSGIAWEPARVIVFRGHYPSIYIEGDSYHLLYETHDSRFSGNRSERKEAGRGSRIEMRTSTDLVTWSKPRLLLKATDVPYAKDYISSPGVSRPQIIKFGDTYRLYFGASHLSLPDSGQKASRYFGYAVAKDLKGPYLVTSQKPLIECSPDSRWRNLATGGIRLVETKEALYGFQCGIYWDEKTRKTGSAMILLKSEDGLNFRVCREEPILVPSSRGWASSYIMGCDVRYENNEKCWYCYFSANGKDAIGLNRFFKKQEAVGLLIGAVAPTVNQTTTEQQLHGVFL